MANLEKIKNIIKKISMMGEIKEHICFFGGCMPYIIHGKDSFREHSDIDVLVDVDYMDYLRTLLQEEGYYNPERDSVNLGLDKDYGLKVFIDGVYVEFEPMSLQDGIFTRMSFVEEKQLAGVEKLPYINVEDIMIPIEFDGVRVYSKTPELIKVGKEKYMREKDVQDVAFINEHGFDTAKYLRAQEMFYKRIAEVNTFDNLKGMKL